MCLGRCTKFHQNNSQSRKRRNISKDEQTSWDQHLCLNPRNYWSMCCTETLNHSLLELWCIIKTINKSAFITKKQERNIVIRQGRPLHILHVFTCYIILVCLCNNIPKNALLPYQGIPFTRVAFWYETQYFN